MRLVVLIVPVQVVEEVFPELEQFGDRLTSELDVLGRQCELQPPFLRCVCVCWADSVSCSHHFSGVFVEGGSPTLVLSLNSDRTMPGGAEWTS